MNANSASDANFYEIQRIKNKTFFFQNIRPRVFNSYFSFILILLYVKRENQLTSTVFFHPLTALEYLILLKKWNAIFT